MRMRGDYVLNKGAWPNVSSRDHSCYTAYYCLAQKGAYLVKDMKIERRQRFLRCWNPELARECSDIRAVQGQSSLCAYTRNAPNSERLDQQSSMRLLANMRL